MKKTIQVMASSCVLLFAMLTAAQVATAQDPVKVDPAHYKLLYENKAVRILEYQDTAGHKVPKHSHPYYWVYVFSEATRLFTDWSPATACTGAGKTVKLTAGEKITKTPVTHCEENTGNTDTHLLIVEFKGPVRNRNSHRISQRR